MSDKDNTGAHQPARRQLLKTLGALGGAFAVGGGCPMHGGLLRRQNTGLVLTVQPVPW